MSLVRTADATAAADSPAAPSRLVVLPPLGDPTLAPALAAGEELLDAAGAFVGRLADPAGLAGEAARLDRPGGPAAQGRAERALFLRACADALAEAELPDPTALRAVGMALRLRSAGDPEITAALDDLWLRHGSTQRGADVLRAAAGSALFAPEVAAAARAVAAAGAAEVVVDSDRQLPFAFALAAAAPPATLTLTGRFVARHHAALARLDAPGRARLSPRARRLLLGGCGGPGNADPVVWVTRAAECPARGPWAGWLDAESVARLPAGATARCAGLVVTVAGLRTWGRAVGERGHPVDLAAVVPPLAARVPVAVEVLVGAPGVPAVEYERLVAEEVRAPVRLAGFRPFRLPLPGTPHAWAVPPRPAAELPDLARWLPYDDETDDTGAPDEPAAPAAAAESAGPGGQAGPGSPGPGGPGGYAWRQRLIGELLAGRAAGLDLFPGRVAAAVTQPSRWPRVHGSWCWDPAARAVGTEHLAPDGGPPGRFLVSLRGGGITRLSGHTAAVVDRLRHGGARASALLGRLAPARREELLRQLGRVRAVRSGGEAA
ncbi:hypothetical protein [Streptomyces hoynatensis]|uniref:Uncharacterized protein n=1 Tax=Streptomyces hoynatensis TaxID=1141874 RepID=A0A3A9Z690_9ACTN|nr:hypothetical protein [Streptomyces hoynatensis]RKN43992.1 hypothetical protein D7294_09955 [Streptomyces hoynatensis]